MLQRSQTVVDLVLIVLSVGRGVSMLITGSGESRLMLDELGFDGGGA